MTRAEKIKKGKIYWVYPDAEPENILFEGSRNACFSYLSKNKLNKNYKTGNIRIGQVLFEFDKTKSYEKH